MPGCEAFWSSMVCTFRRLPLQRGCLGPQAHHQQLTSLHWARPNSGSHCFAVSSVDVTMFMPFAGRAPTDDPDTCPKQIVTGNRIYVAKARSARRLIA